eukprot:2264282-Prymnesium_polylepis.1
MCIRDSHSRRPGATASRAPRRPVRRWHHPPRRPHSRRPCRGARARKASHPRTIRSSPGRGATRRSPSEAARPDRPPARP